MQGVVIIILAKGIRIGHPKIWFLVILHWRLLRIKVTEIQKEAFSKLPLSYQEQRFLRKEDCHAPPLPGEFYGLEDGKSAPSQACTNFTNYNLFPTSFPIYLPSPNLAPLEVKTPLFCNLFTNVLPCVKMIQTFRSDPCFGVFISFLWGSPYASERNPFLLLIIFFQCNLQHFIHWT